MEVGKEELSIVRALVELLVELFELFSQVYWPSHGGHKVCASNCTLVFNVALACSL